MSNTFRISLILSLLIHLVLINSRIKIINKREFKNIKINLTDIKNIELENYVLKLPKKSEHKAKADEGIVKVEPGEVDRVGIRPILDFDDLLRTYKTMLVDSLFLFVMTPPSFKRGQDEAFKQRIRYFMGYMPIENDTAYVMVHVSYEGKMDSLVVLRQPNQQVFMDGIKYALKQTQFNPGRMDEVAVPNGVWVRIPIRFEWQ